ncbi:hypothetical protein EDB83DRAFT_2317224 [Lactarius deliciosus]|nr:hypothetical protein EDB83DRAFT_2317224 [Lactarius deliciosus]
MAIPPCSRGKGTREGTGPPTPSLPHSHGRGAQRGHTAPPLRIAPAPFPFPLCATPFVQKGCAQPPTPPFPLGHATLYAQGTRGHATWFPPSPFAWKRCMWGRRPQHPFPLGRAAPYVWEGGTRGHAIPGLALPYSRRWGVHTASFAREGAHEAKPCPPPHVSRSRAGAVSVRPCSPRPHPVFARRSMT